MNKAYIAIDRQGNTIAFVAAANRADAARRLRRMGVAFIAVEPA